MWISGIIVTHSILIKSKYSTVHGITEVYNINKKTCFCFELVHAIVIVKMRIHLQAASYEGLQTPVAREVCKLSVMGNA